MFSRSVRNFCNKRPLQVLLRQKLYRFHSVFVNSGYILLLCFSLFPFLTFYIKSKQQKFNCRFDIGIYFQQIVMSIIRDKHKDIDWAASWQNQQNECAPSEDSDQPGHLPSLIRVFAVCMKKAWVLTYLLSAQRRLWSDWAEAHADLSLRWAHSHFVGFVMSRLSFDHVICFVTAILYSPNVLIPQEEKIIVDDGGDPDTVEEKLVYHNLVCLFVEENIFFKFLFKFFKIWSMPVTANRYYTIQAANNKGADKTAQTHRLICAFVVRIWHKQVFLWSGSYVDKHEDTCNR